MQMTTEHRKQTGAFYTPKMWADKAVEYIRRVCPFLEDFVFYDPAAGEGALLDALPATCEKYASTLEPEDVEILKSKGYKAWQFDFLRNDDNIFETAPDDGLLRSYQEGRLIVFTNPPFFICPAESKTWYTRYTYPVTCDATALFLMRIMYEVMPVLTCSFSKMDIYQAPQLAAFRDEFNPILRYIDGFISPSMSWNLSGKFPIAFSIWL